AAGAGKREEESPCQDAESSATWGVPEIHNSGARSRCSRRGDPTDLCSSRNGENAWENSGTGSSWSRKLLQVKLFSLQIFRVVSGLEKSMTRKQKQRSLRVQPKKRLRQAAASRKQEEEQRKRRKKQVKDSGLEITRMDVEEALVDLQLCKQVQVSFFESWEDLGEFATMFTKAVAEAPFKREREKTGFSFYLEKAWCRGVKVDPSGKGLLEVWKRQIQQFNRVSLKMAEAIVSAYPSPQLLNQAYSRCSSEQEQENMLANIPVCRGDGATATSRRIGPELSRRIYLQMTSHNPDLYLDSTR
uniref:Essential meiotic structure-specific endonuclease 1 n=1 Tax=Buteo japonicus TaxID=224669 RepID=A0A8C0HRM5_9AVES